MGYDLMRVTCIACPDTREACSAQCCKFLEKINIQFFSRGEMPARILQRKPALCRERIGKSQNLISFMFISFACPNETYQRKGQH